MYTYPINIIWCRIHITGHYLFIESSSPRIPNDTARLFSPVYGAPDASALAEGVCFTFWFHMYGSSTGESYIYISIFLLFIILEGRRRSGGIHLNLERFPYIYFIYRLLRRLCVLSESSCSSFLCALLRYYYILSEGVWSNRGSNGSNRKMARSWPRRIIFTAACILVRNTRGDQWCWRIKRRRRQNICKKQGAKTREGKRESKKEMSARGWWMLERVAPGRNGKGLLQKND